MKKRIGKPVFVVATKEEFKKKTGWYVLSEINEFKAENKNHGYIEFTDCNCINFGNTQFFRFFDEEVTFQELKEILDTEEKAKKKTGYERAENGTLYSTITSQFKAVNTREVTYKVDDVKYNIANYFNNETLAKNIARAEQLKYQLRRFAALNGGIPSQENWQNLEIKKYFIDYLYHVKSISSCYTIFCREFGQIYFKSKESCEKAMEIFKDELLWYFTEFEEMLY